ncbi:Nonribosomal peptide synthetase 14 [Madurella mycetomatis]|uniref:Nonribosomal peptide synthetase 14 n=1 Tax=Madurella mycetomatis TaxID=100816 RepID=A0A175VQN1_9PEZI|nr:Nonribosomal peptide synthetase 14 [Madurella mycetomatis]
MAEVASPEFSIHMDTTKSYINEEGHSPISAPDTRHAWAEGSNTPSLCMTTETGSGSTGGGGGSTSSKPPVPVAVCGMAMRLPGGISTGDAFWDFLVSKGDACARIPAARYATHGPRGNQVVPSSGAAAAAGNGEKKAAEGEDERDWRTHSYMLNHVDLAAFDASLFSMTRAELDIVDPQQRLLLKVTRECFENAGETGWRGKDVGVYIGSFGEDWNDIQYHGLYDMNLYRLVGSSDFVLANSKKDDPQPVWIERQEEEIKRVI